MSTGKNGATSRTSPDRECRKFIIWGRVQGVWFRESTRFEAESLGLAGHAINLDDGSVEVIAAGGAAELNKLAEWLRTGPPLARVTQVIEEAVADSGDVGFRTF